MQADLVQHATEIDQAANFGVATAETGDVGHAKACAAGKFSQSLVCN